MQHQLSHWPSHGDREFLPIESNGRYVSKDCVNLAHYLWWANNQNLPVQCLNLNQRAQYNAQGQLNSCCLSWRYDRNHPVITLVMTSPKAIWLQRLVTADCISCINRSLARIVNAIPIKARPVPLSLSAAFDTTLESSRCFCQEKCIEVSGGNHF